MQSETRSPQQQQIHPGRLTYTIDDDTSSGHSGARYAERKIKCGSCRMTIIVIGIGCHDRTMPNKLTLALLPLLAVKP